MTQEKASEFFARLARNEKRLEQTIIRDVIAVEAELFHAKNFRDEGFTDTGFTPWPKRKKEDKRPGRRALLVKTGTLRGHALKGRVQGNGVAFVFPLEYEKVHNEGLRAGRGAGFDMPKRQFVGESDYLEKRIKAKAEQLLKRFLNGESI